MRCSFAVLVFEQSMGTENKRDARPEEAPEEAFDEESRLRALQDFDVLDSPSEVEFDDLALIASQICKTPIALISLIDEHRQWFKARVGLKAQETPREISFCTHAIRESETFIIEDARLDDRFRNNPLVTDDPKIRFYAGAQLKTREGQCIGTLCVVDQVPRKLDASQVEGLEALARQVISNLERKKQSVVLRERERFFGKFVEIIPDLLGYVDRDYRYRYVNPSYMHCFKVDSEQLLGKKAEEVFGGAFLRMKPYMDQALLGEPQSAQLTISCEIHGEKVVKTIQLKCMPDHHPDKGVVGFFFAISDITLLKEAENRALVQGRQLENALNQALESERAFRAIFENAPVGIIRVNSRLEFVVVNPAFCKFLGYSEADLTSMSILSVTHPEDKHASIDAIKRMTEFSATTFDPGGDGIISRLQKRYIHRSGRIVWGLVTSRAVRFTDDGETFIFSVIEDITEAREKEEALKLAQAKLVSYAKMATLGEMASGIAHEINNPLAIIVGKTGLLIRQMKTGSVDSIKVESDLETISNTAYRIAKIIKGLAAFSRNSENDPLEPSRVSKIIEDTISLCGERLKNHGVEVRVYCEDDSTIECRAAQISQVLMNLIGNAFDAIESQSKKWIEIHAAREDNQVKIRVIDSGTGIPPQIVDRMMNPFFTTKEVGRGTGLGLSISKGIAESHRGALVYDPSCLNTCFELKLPILQEKMHPPILMPGGRKAF